MSSATAHAEVTDTPEIGYNYGEIELARSAATGGAQRALSNSTGALFINPANIAASRVYHIAAFAQIWPEAKRQSYGAAGVDFVSNSMVAGGLGGTWNIQDPDGLDRQWNDLRFALATPIGDAFLVGLGGRYLWGSQDGFIGSLAELGQSPASAGLTGENILGAFSLDAGLTVRPSEEFAIALVGNNLNNPGTGFQPTSVGGGIGFGSDTLAVEADLVADFTTWERTTLRAMAGVELLFGDHVLTRGGYRFDAGAESHGLSLGLGYVDRTFTAEAAVRHSPGENSATAVVLALTYHLDSGLTTSPSDTF